MDINQNITNINIADSLDEKKLQDIADECYRGYETDVSSRKEWEDNLEEWTKLAIQVRDVKSYPWPNASNVKFPLLSTAAMQFSARAYPTLIPSDNHPVKCRVVGADPQGQKAARAQRISEHMSFQLTEEMDDWEEDMDRLLIVLSIAGTVFKKSYYDSLYKKNCSELVYPRDLVVNYWSKNLEKAARKSQRLWFTKNDVQERINMGLYLDVDLPEPNVGDVADKNENKNRTLTFGDTDHTTPYLVIEQHTFLDLDDDGYREPYVVTFEHSSKKVLRIVARYDSESIVLNDKGAIAYIKPIEYFTKYGFIPNPDGGFYDIGFGLLLGALNDSANTIINQLIDAGSLSNLQSGFLAKGLRIKLGDTKFAPGEWKAVNATGDDLKKSIFPLPTRDPSNVLFQLLQLVVTSTKELASVAEIFVGKMPGQNTPASTTMASIEQGMKVFTAIFKRVYRSFTKELRKLYKLNKAYHDPQKYVDVIDDPASLQDYQGNENDVVPSADPQSTSDTLKMMKAEGLMQAMQLGTLDPMQVTMRLLQSQGQVDIDALIRKEPPPPDPKAQEMQMKMQMEQQKHQMDMQSKQADMQIQQQLAQMQLQVEQAKLEIEQQRLQLEQAKLQMEMQRAQLDAEIKQQSAVQDVTLKEAQHQQKMKQAQEVKETNESKQG